MRRARRLQGQVRRRPLTAAQQRIRTKHENLESGATVDQFLEWFPGVTKQRAFAVLKTQQKLTTDDADCGLRRARSFLIDPIQQMQRNRMHR